MKCGQWTKALTLYNEAVILAETNGDNLCLALANRAFVWMKLEQFDKAEKDLLWIISMKKYPKESYYKVYQRLGISFQKLSKTRSKTKFISNTFRDLSTST